MATINWPIAEQWFMKGLSWTVLDNSFYFFDLGNILQSNHSEVKFWRGDWVRKKQKDMKRKSHFPTGKEEPSSSRLQCSNFFPSKKKLEKYQNYWTCIFTIGGLTETKDPLVMRVVDWQMVSMGRFRTKVSIHSDNQIYQDGKLLPCWSKKRVLFFRKEMRTVKKEY